MKKFVIVLFLINSFIVYSQEFKYEYYIQLSYDYYIIFEKGDQNKKDSTIIQLEYHQKNDGFDAIIYGSSDFVRDTLLNPTNHIIVLDSTKFNINNYTLTLLLTNRPKIFINEYYKRIRIVFDFCSTNRVIRSLRALTDEELNEIRNSLKLNQTATLEKKGIVKTYIIL